MMRQGQGHRRHSEESEVSYRYEGVFSSGKLERATYDSVAFRFIAANDHPDHDIIARFWHCFLMERRMAARTRRSLN
jgi:hypothetical protein